MEKLRPALELIEPGESIADGVSAIDLPGHTAGHTGLWIRSANEDLLYLADLAHHPVIMFENPEWTIASDSRPSEAVETRRRVFTDLTRRRTRVALYRTPFPGLGHIRERDAGFEWVPEFWTV